MREDIKKQRYPRSHKKHFENVIFLECVNTIYITVFRRIQIKKNVLVALTFYLNNLEIFRFL